MNHENKNAIEPDILKHSPKKQVWTRVNANPKSMSFWNRY